MQLIIAVQPDNLSFIYTFLYEKLFNFFLLILLNLPMFIRLSIYMSAWGIFLVKRALREI